VTRYVLITRHPSDCAELQTLLDPYGFKVRPYPVLRLSDVDDETAWQRATALDSDLEARKWIVIASPRAPVRFVTGCHRHRCQRFLDLPAAAVGEATAAAARRAGLRVELVGPGTGHGLATQLLQGMDQPTTFIFACGRDRRPELPNALADAGHEVVPIVVYRMDPTPPRELPPLGPSLEAVILTSPRAAELYLAGVGGLPLPCQHWALGPTTRKAAAAIGIDCLIPPESSIESLAEELCKT
jgi:uroporphyrinogen-III synthase